MKIRYLGTGGCEGLPAFFCKCAVCENARKVKGREIRSRMSVLINDDLMIDFCPDTFLHTLSVDFDLSAVKYLLITHTHSDHYYPEDLIMRYGAAAINPTEKVLQVYGNKQVEERFNSVAPLEDVCQSTPMYALKPMKSVEVGNYVITAFRSDHMVDEESYIYLIEQNGIHYLHATDSAELTLETLLYLKEKKIRLAVVSFDCTFGTRKEEWGGHMNLWQNIKMKKVLEENGNITSQTKVIATHISHFSGDTYENLDKIAQENGILVSYDGLEIVENL